MLNRIKFIKIVAKTALDIALDRDSFITTVNIAHAFAGMTAINLNHIAKENGINIGHFSANDFIQYLGELTTLE
jgi:hypothetical protein